MRKLLICPLFTLSVLASLTSCVRELPETTESPGTSLTTPQSTSAKTSEPCHVSNDDPEVRRAIQSLPNLAKTFRPSSKDSPSWVINWNYHADEGNYDSCSPLSYVTVTGGGISGNEISTHASAGTTAVLFFHYGKFAALGGNGIHFERLKVVPQSNDSYDVTFSYRGINDPKYHMALGTNKSFTITYSWQDDGLVEQGSYPSFDDTTISKYEPLDLSHFPQNLWRTTPAEKIPFVENYLREQPRSKNPADQSSLYFRAKSKEGDVVCGVRFPDSSPSFSYQNTSGCYLEADPTVSVLRQSSTEPDIRGADIPKNRNGKYVVGAQSPYFEAGDNSIPVLAKGSPLYWGGFTFYVSDDGVIIGQELSGAGFKFDGKTAETW